MSGMCTVIHFTRLRALQGPTCSGEAMYTMCTMIRRFFRLAVQACVRLVLSKPEANLHPTLLQRLTCVYVCAYLHTRIDTSYNVGQKLELRCAAV